MRAAELANAEQPAAQRPTGFFRGNDTYDKSNVGFVSTISSEGTTRFMKFETSRAGNSNAGHDALLEYMKTL